MAGFKQISGQAKPGYGPGKLHTQLATDGVWQGLLNKMRQGGQVARMKLREPANQSEFANTPDLLQCGQSNFAELNYWQSSLPAKFALLHAADLSSADYAHILAACHQNGLALLILGQTTALISDAALSLNPAQLSCKDWLALHQLATVLLQPAEIRATHLGIVLSAAEVFAKPAIQVARNGVAAAAFAGAHPHCTLSCWLNPELPTLMLQIQDHLLVASESLQKSERHLQEILQAESFSADYQRWYGDILTGKHIAP